LGFTSDKIVTANSFDTYPHNKATAKVLASVIATPGLSLPVRLKLTPPPPSPVIDDVVPLFVNNNGDYLGVQLLRGNGRLILLPKFQSNADVIETFLHRVAPKLYNLNTHGVLTDAFASPAECATRAALRELAAAEKEIA
jgi:hypothetical protein